MTKLGRPFPEKEQRIKAAVYNSVPVDLPGKTLNEIATDVKRATGVDRSTVWRHLKRFSKLRLVLHEGRFYRRNPIHGLDTSGYSISIKEEGKARAWIRREADIFEAMRREIGLDFWNPKVPPILNRTNLGDPNTLAKALEALMTSVDIYYMLCLISIGDAPNIAAAREIASLLFDSYLRGDLMSFARRFWEQRAKANQALNKVFAELEKQPGIVQDSTPYQALSRKVSIYHGQE